MKHLFLSALAFLITINLQSQSISKITESTEIVATYLSAFVFNEAGDEYTVYGDVPSNTLLPPVFINIETVKNTEDEYDDYYLVFSFIKYTDNLKQETKYSYVMTEDYVTSLSNVLDYIWSQRKEDNIRILDYPDFGSYEYKNKDLNLIMNYGENIWGEDNFGTSLSRLKMTIDMKDIKRLRKHLSSSFPLE
tara:strand:- start:116 stop:691 length:576 start_codon:yes stop_codon:yes gene_type:complete